jgi:hypothetical protein
MHTFDPGIVEEQRGCTVLGCGGLCVAEHLDAIGNISLLWHNGIRAFVRGRLGCVTVDVDGQNLGAGDGESERHRLADTTACTGHDRGPSGIFKVDESSGC